MKYGRLVYQGEESSTIVLFDTIEEAKTGKKVIPSRPNQRISHSCYGAIYVVTQVFEEKKVINTYWEERSIS